MSEVGHLGGLISRCLAPRGFESHSRNKNNRDCMTSGVTDEFMKGMHKRHMLDTFISLLAEPNVLEDREECNNSLVLLEAMDEIMPNVIFDEDDDKNKQIKDDYSKKIKMSIANCSAFKNIEK